MANKVVQLVDKNSNNLYPIAGSVITDAVSTTAISNQAVTNPKIENGAVNGVANDATAIGTAKLALNTVGTPNLRDESVTSNKIDWTTLTGDPQVPTASISLQGATSPNYGCNLTRIGNIVFANSSSVLPSWIVTSQDGYLIGVLPVGYRPVESVGISGSLNYVSGIEGETFGIFAYPDGNLYAYSRIKAGGTRRLFLSGSWITKDAWPS